MRILLANSYYLNRHPFMQQQPHLYPPLGPLYVAAYLRKAAIGDVSFFDTTFAENETEFARRILTEKPQIVGIQSAITTRGNAKTMISIAKGAGAIVVLGGPDPTVSYSDYLYWGADFVILGEGEVTMSELVHRLSEQDRIAATGLRGLAFKGDDGIVVNQPRPMIENLDSIPWPALDLIDVTQYLELWRKTHGYTEMHIITSRGCPFTCTWCSRAVFGRTFRQRSPSDVIDEIVHLRNTYNIDRLWIADDTFALDKKWVGIWHNEMLSRNLQIPFRCMTRIDRVNTETIGQLKNAGCYQIHLGVESGSQRVLDSMQKRITVKQIYRAANIIRKANIELGMFIMFGYPGEQIEDIEATKKLLFQIKPDTLGVSIAYPVPGTAFYDLVKTRLKRNYSDRWADTGSAYQLMFDAPFPQSYYRNLIEYVLRHLTWKREYAQHSWVDLIFIARSRLITWLFEAKFYVMTKWKRVHHLGNLRVNRP